MSCFVDVSTQPSYQTSDRVFRILGRLLGGGLGLSKLVYTDTVYLLAVAVGNGDAENDRRSWLMSAGVAAANQVEPPLVTLLILISVGIRYPLEVQQRH